MPEIPSNHVCCQSQSDDVVLDNVTYYYGNKEWRKSPTSEAHLMTWGCKGTVVKVYRREPVMFFMFRPLNGSHTFPLFPHEVYMDKEDIESGGN